MRSDIGVRLVVGDCRIVVAGMQADSFDCIVTDPPYGETNIGWDKRLVGWAADLRRVLKRSGSMWVFGSQRMFMEAAGEFAGWKLAQDVIWEKHNGSSFANDRFRRVHEIAVQFYRDDAPWAGVYRLPQFTNDATARTVRKKARPAHWHGATGPTGPTVYASEDGGPRLIRSVIYARSEHGRAVHPTQKPVEIVEPLLLYSCPPGGVVLDPFSGSGTVGVVAARHGRQATLIEVNTNYVLAACRRIGEDVRYAK